MPDVRAVRDAERFDDPIPPDAEPVMMTNAYVELGGANLRCLALSVEIDPENSPISQTTFCGVQDYPGPTKWHFRAKLAQSFSAGATHDTLYSALKGYETAGDLLEYKVRAHASREVSATNPSFEGELIPQPYRLFGGDAGAASEVDIDWSCTGAPEINTGTAGP
jgi:hypothetical protein